MPRSYISFSRSEGFVRFDEDGNTIGFAILNLENWSERELPFEAEFRRVSS